MSDLERMRELSGIINSKSQLIEAAAGLAKKQLKAAQRVLGNPETEVFTSDDIEVAKIIAANMSAHDLISTK